MDEIIQRITDDVMLSFKDELDLINILDIMIHKRDYRSSYLGSCSKGMMYDLTDEIPEAIHRKIIVHFMQGLKEICKKHRASSSKERDANFETACYKYWFDSIDNIIIITKKYFVKHSINALKWYDGYCHERLNKNLQKITPDTLLSSRKELLDNVMNEKNIPELDIFFNQHEKKINVSYKSKGRFGFSLNFYS